MQAQDTKRRQGQAIKAGDGVFAKGGWLGKDGATKRGLGQSIDEVLRPPKAMRRIIENSIAVNACAGA